MNIIEIDLRTQPKGCTEHPLVRLEKTIKGLKDGEGVKVITDVNIIPLTAVRLIAKRAGLKVRIIKEQPPLYEVILVRE